MDTRHNEFVHWSPQTQNKQLEDELKTLRDEKEAWRKHSDAYSEALRWEQGRADALVLRNSALLAEMREVIEGAIYNYEIDAQRVTGGMVDFYKSRAEYLRSKIQPDATPKDSEPHK